MSFVKSSFVLFVLAVFSSSPSFAQEEKKPPRERQLYVGIDSTEAIMRYSHYVEMSSYSKPSKKNALEQIEEQLVHFFGPMGEAKIMAVPRGNHEISKIVISKKKNTKSTYTIKYNYKGTIVLKNGPTTEYSVIMPRNPDTIYQAGMVGDHNPCTDHHYQSEGDFWYFWNPSNYECPLESGRDYFVVTTKIERIANTKVSYPEYHRLVNPETKTIDVYLLMGMDDPSLNRDPNKSTDVNADNFRDLKETLVVDLQFKSKKWEEDSYITILPEHVTARPYVEEFYKEVQIAGYDSPILYRVILFFGPSGIDEDSDAFHYFFKYSVDTGSVMMYDGHSGLGGHLDLPSIEQRHDFKFQPDPNKYQIYYFNSCSSYTYYNTMFFDRKITDQDARGTKSLDIFTNGLATYFSVMHHTNMSLIMGINAWATHGVWTSYQALASEIDSKNLFGINGDEDNPTEPVK